MVKMLEEKLERVVQEKMEKIDEKMERVVQGQEEMRQGQEEMRQGQEEMRQGQEEMRQGQEEMRQGQEEMRQGQEEMRQGQEEMRQGQEEMRIEQQKIRIGVEKMERVVPTLSQQAFELCPASSTSWDAEWHKTVCRHYRLHGCIILSQIFPETHEWMCKEFPKDYFDFCVSEHIYHKKMARSAAALGIEIADPRNGLPLLKHFEVLYQDGDMTLLPCPEENPLAQEPSTIRVQIHIADDFHNTFLQWVSAKSEVTEKPEKEWCVHSVEPVQGKRETIKYPEKPIKLGELHEKVIKISPQPFMRSLYMQARMAHRLHRDLPDPDTMLDMFKSQCPDRMDYVRQCLGIGGQSVADAIVEEPIAWDEDK